MIKNDNYYMKKALKEAARGKQLVFPNPRVGCIIVEKNKILSKGYHRKFGEDHAEKMAFKNLNKKAKDATLYVTLEPCNHHGKTPPCTDLINRDQIKKVVISNLDPNPDSGKAIKKLREKNIKVVTGVCEKKGQKLNRRFFTFHEKKRPYVILKLAATLDGYIAEKNGHSKWITNEKSRKEVHNLRSNCDAILIGRKTAEFDNPSLTSHGQGKNPRIVLIDPNRKINQNQKVLKSGPIIFSNEDLGKNKILNVTIILDKLYKENIQSLLVEGGGDTITNFINSKKFDELQVFYAPKLIGQGVSMFHSIKKLDESLDLSIDNIKQFNNDIKITYHRKY